MRGGNGAPMDERKKDPTKKSARRKLKETRATTAMRKKIRAGTPR